jgi:hypothetical protein
MDTEGYLKKKNWLTPGIRTAQMMPISQARKVDAGIVGSSVLATADRTSGYGDSSSSTKAVASKLGSSSLTVHCETPCHCTKYESYTMKKEKSLTSTLLKFSESSSSRSVDNFSSSKNDMVN